MKDLFSWLSHADLLQPRATAPMTDDIKAKALDYVGSLASDIRDGKVIVGSLYMEAETVEGAKDGWLTRTPTGRRALVIVIESAEVLK